MWIPIQRRKTSEVQYVSAILWVSFWQKESSSWYRLHSEDLVYVYWQESRPVLALSNTKEPKKNQYPLQYSKKDSILYTINIWEELTSPIPQYPMKDSAILEDTVISPCRYCRCKWIYHLQHQSNWDGSTNHYQEWWILGHTCPSNHKAWMTQEGWIWTWKSRCECRVKHGRQGVIVAGSRVKPSGHSGRVLITNSRHWLPRLPCLMAYYAKLWWKERSVDKTEVRKVIRSW